MGDILLSSPLVRILRQRFPQARIDFLLKSQFADLYVANPYLNNLLTLDAGKGRRELFTLRSKIRCVGYDAVIDIHNNFRSAFLRRGAGSELFIVRKYKWQRFLLVKLGINTYREIVPVHQRYLRTPAALQLEDDGLGLELYIPAAEKGLAADFLRFEGLKSDKLIIAMAPGAGFYSKRWPVDNFLELAKICIEHMQAQIVLLGNEKEKSLCCAIQNSLGSNVINVTGKLSLLQSAAALQHSHLLVSNDTGLMHMATAVKTPVVAIFGSTSQELGFFPVGHAVTIIENKTLSCRPCTHIGRETCPRKHFRCMTAITPGMVFEAVQRTIGRNV
jgi:heptosyltransferase-2